VTVLGVGGVGFGGGPVLGFGGSKVTVLGVKKGSKSGGFERFLRGFERFLRKRGKKRGISQIFGPRWGDLTRHVDLSSLKPL